MDTIFGHINSNCSLSLLRKIFQVSFSDLLYNWYNLASKLCPFVIIWQKMRKSGQTFNFTF